MIQYISADGDEFPYLNTSDTLVEIQIKQAHSHEVNVPVF